MNETNEKNADQSGANGPDCVDRVVRKNWRDLPSEIDLKFNEYRHFQKAGKIEIHRKLADQSVEVYELPNWVGMIVNLERRLERHEIQRNIKTALLLS